MAVVRDRQGAGIGSAIIEALLKGQGGGAMYITCGRELEGYYRRFGFRRVQRADSPYFARLMPVVNVFARRAGTRIILMRRPG